MISITAAKLFDSQSSPDDQLLREITSWADQVIGAAVLTNRTDNMGVSARGTTECQPRDSVPAMGRTEIADQSGSDDIEVLSASGKYGYSVEETAKLLGVSRNSAYEAVRAGQIPSIRIGRRLIIPRMALERMLGLAEVTRSKR